MDMNTDFEENSPYQEGIISEFYQRPDHYYVQDAPELGNLVYTDRLVTKFLPKQMDIDKCFKHNTKKSTKRYTSANDSERNSSRIFD